MTGSNAQRLAWGLPLLAAFGFYGALAARRTGPAPEPAPMSVIAPVASAAPAPTAPATDLAAYEHLRREIAGLRRRIQERETQLRSPAVRPGPAPAASPRPALTDAALAPDQWRDAGNATPAALIETVLWAGAGGDIGRLGNLLDFTPEALAAAEALWGRVPPDLRPAGSDATALIALLATDSIPLAEARLAGNFVQENGDHLLILRLDQQPRADTTPAERGPRLVRLTARATPGSGGTDWRILVPPSAIATWSERLDLPPPPATPAGSE